MGVSQWGGGGMPTVLWRGVFEGIAVGGRENNTDNCPSFNNETKGIPKASSVPQTDRKQEDQCCKTFKQLDN